MLGYIGTVGILVFYGYLCYLVPVYHIICAYSFSSNTGVSFCGYTVCISECLVCVLESSCIECGSLVARPVTATEEWYILVEDWVLGVVRMEKHMVLLARMLVSEVVEAVVKYSGVCLRNSLLWIEAIAMPVDCFFCTHCYFTEYIDYISKTKAAADTNCVLLEQTVCGYGRTREIPIYTIHMCTRSAAAVLLEFYALQERLFIAEAETSLVLYRLYNPTLFDTVSIVVYFIVPDEYTMYVRKLQCFCFDILYVQPLESIELPVLFYIESVKNMRTDVKNLMFYYYLLAV